jgi:hypothetical protein
MTDPEQTTGRAPCRSCGSTAAPIVFGVPTAAQQAAASRGEVQLAACAIPTWPTCRRCGHRVQHQPSRWRRLLRLGP